MLSCVYVRQNTNVIETMCFLLSFSLAFSFSVSVRPKSNCGMLRANVPLLPFPLILAFSVFVETQISLQSCCRQNTVLSPLKSKLQMPFALEAGQYFHVHYLLLLWAKLQYFINNCVRAVQVRHFFL